MKEDESGWKSLKVDGSGRQWMKVDESGLNGWKWMKWMKVDESGWKWMRVDEFGWKWTKVDESGWRWLIVDESGRKWMKYPRSYQHLWYFFFSIVRCCIPPNTQRCIIPSVSPTYSTTVLYPSVDGLSYILSMHVFACVCFKFCYKMCFAFV